MNMMLGQLGIQMKQPLNAVDNMMSDYRKKNEVSNLVGKILISS